MADVYNVILDTPTVALATQEMFKNSLHCCVVKILCDQLF
jgi:hypothetical protein